ncbi:MAG: hypothetical protein ACREJ0_09655, partial [Geminicoccaceae bacterium]
MSRRLMALAVRPVDVEARLPVPAGSSGLAFLRAWTVVRPRLRTAVLGEMRNVATSGRQGTAPGVRRVVWARTVAVASVLLVGPLGGCAWGAEGLVVEQARLGNVFLSDQVVQIPVRSAGVRVAWRVEDFLGTTVALGTVTLSRGRAVIEPDVGRNGNFEVQLDALEGDASVASAETAFAVIAPAGDTPPEESRFGVMTHFAQGWDRDIFPLIAAAGIKHIRDEQYWDRVEREPGRFVFSQGYTTYMA